MSKSTGLNEALSRALSDASEPMDEDEDLMIDAEGKISKKVYIENGKESKGSLQKQFDDEEAKVAMLNDINNAVNLPSATSDDMVERAKYIPIRLTYEERKSLRLVSAAIHVSDYTNSVDVVFKNRARRHHVRLQQIVSF